MTKKVFELAKELNISNKEILTKADELGIKVKTHVSILSDENIKKIKDAVHAGKQAAKAKNSVGKPIVDEEYLANKHKSPAEKAPAENADAGKSDAPAPAASEKSDARPEKKENPASEKAEPAKSRNRKNSRRKTRLTRKQM